VESASEMNALERAILEDIAADHETPPSVKDQLGVVMVVNRQHTGGGTFLNLAVPAEFPRTNPQNTEVSGPLVTIPEVPEGAVTILFVRDGAVSFLEIASVGDWWPETISEFTLGL